MRPCTLFHNSFKFKKLMSDESLTLNELVFCIKPMITRWRGVERADKVEREGREEEGLECQGCY